MAAVIKNDQLARMLSEASDSDLIRLAAESSDAARLRLVSVAFGSGLVEKNSKIG